MPNIGPMELIVVLVIALIILGPKRLPDVGRSVGRGLKEFKDGVGGLTGGRDEPSTEITAAMTDERPAGKPPPDRADVRPYPARGCARPSPRTRRPPPLRRGRTTRG